MKAYPQGLKRPGASIKDDLTALNTNSDAHSGSMNESFTSTENSPMDSNTSSQPLHSTQLHPVPTYTSLKDTISNLPRTPQISRKVRACSACKKQKIRCDFDGDGTGDSAKCVRCRKMKLDCVVNRSLQTILDEDVEWKQKMAEDLAQLQRAVEDILTATKMRPLSTYTTTSISAACSPNVPMTSLSKDSPESTIHQAPCIKEEDGSTKGSPCAAQPPSTTPSITAVGPSPERSGSAPRMLLPMTRENSPEPPQEPSNHTRNNNNASGATGGRTTSPYYDQYAMSTTLSTNPMGSLYEVTKLRSLRSNSTANIHSHPSLYLADGPLSRFASSRSSLRMSLCIENNDDDLVSRGAIGLEEAEELFDLFKNTLNHYLFDVALVHEDLTSVRNSSSLLFAAILTVSLLHRPSSKTGGVPARSGINASGSGLFQTCYQHFLTLVSSSMFDFPGGGGSFLYPTSQGKMQPPHTRALDNVRALCIAAFWLPDLSWKLSGHAVRIATELNVHQSFRKALAPLPNDPKLTENDKLRLEDERRFHFERARLWYLLYVCDHHFSIAYGRPPVICHSQHEAIRNEGYERYLKSDLCKEGDCRVVSQLALFVVLEQIYETFAGDISEGGLVSEEALFGTRENVSDGENSEEENLRRDGSLEGSPGHGDGRKRKNLEEKKLKKKRKVTKGKVDQFNDELDRWKSIWRTRHRVNVSVGDYPAKAVDLHYHFAKLQLNSLALRGVTGNAAESITFSPRRAAMARVAIESAKHVLGTVLRMQEIRDSLIGVPLYVHTVITFAAVFLLKIVGKWRKLASIADLVSPVEPIWKLVGDVIEALRDAATGKTNNAKKEKNAKAKIGAGEMHIVWFISSGLEKMLKKCKDVVVQQDEADALAKANEKHRNIPGDGPERNPKGLWEDVWQHPRGGTQRASVHEENVCPSEKSHADNISDKTDSMQYELSKRAGSNLKPDSGYNNPIHSQPHQEQQHFYTSQGNNTSQQSQQSHQFGFQPVADNDLYLENDPHNGNPMNAYDLPYYNFASYDFFPENVGIGAGMGNVNGYFSAGLTSFDLLGAIEPLAIGIGSSAAAYYHQNGHEDHHHLQQQQQAQTQPGHP